MVKLETLKNMRSVRDFKDTPLSQEDQDYIYTRFNSLHDNYPGDITLKLLPGDAFYNTDFAEEVGYNGIVIKAPYYLAVVAEETTENAIRTGQIVENMMLNLFEKKIGTCWVSVSDISNTLNAYVTEDASQNVISIIALGYADFKAENVVVKEQKKTIFSWINPYKQKIKDYSVSSDREAIDQFVLNYSMRPISSEELEKRNLAEVMYYARLAPSYENRQPWKYVIMNNGIAILIEENSDMLETSRYLEAGIAMAYFEIAMHQNGYTGSWDLQHKERVKYDHYEEAGVYRY